MPVQFEPYPGVGKVTRKVLRPSREPALRLQVVAIWGFMALLYAITKGPVASRGLAIASVAAIACFLYPFIEGPIRLHARGRLALHAGYQVAAQSGVLLATYRVTHLETLGFAYAGSLISPAEQKNIGVIVEIYIHQQNQDSAQLAEIVGGRTTVPVIVFKSRFEDGFAFETNNISRASIFKPDVGFPSFSFPAVRSTADLYRLHRRLKEDYLAAKRPVVGDKEGELADFIARAEMRHQRIANCGHYRLAAEGDRYVHTWKGAFWHSWLLAWPVKQIRALRLQSRSLRRAEETRHAHQHEAWPSRSLDGPPQTTDVTPISDGSSTARQRSAIPSCVARLRSCRPTSRRLAPRRRRRDNVSARSKSQDLRWLPCAPLAVHQRCNTLIPK